MSKRCYHVTWLSHDIFNELLIWQQKWGLITLMQDILNVLRDEFEHGTTPIGVFVIQAQDFLAMWLAC